MYTFSKDSFSVLLLRQKLLHPQSIDEHTVNCVLKNRDYLDNIGNLNSLVSTVLQNPKLLNLLLEIYLSTDYYQKNVKQSQKMVRNSVKSMKSSRPIYSNRYSNRMSKRYSSLAPMVKAAAGKKSQKKKARNCKPCKPCKKKLSCNPCKKRRPCKPCKTKKAKKGGALNTTIRDIVSVILYIHHTIGALPKGLLSQKGGAAAAAAATSDNNSFELVNSDVQDDFRPTRKTMGFFKLVSSGLDKLSELTSSEQKPKEELFTDFLEQSFNNIIKFREPDLDRGGLNQRRFVFFIQGDIETQDPALGQGILSENKKIVVKLAPYKHYPMDDCPRDIIRLQEITRKTGKNTEKEMKQVLESMDINFETLGSYIYEAKIYDLMNTYMRNAAPARRDVLTYHDYSLIYIDPVIGKRNGIKHTNIVERWTIREPINIKLRTNDVDAMIDIDINTNEIRLAYCDQWMQYSDKLLCSLIVTDAIDPEFDTVNNAINTISNNFSHENDLKIKALYTTIFEALNYYYNNHGFAHWDLHPTNLMCNLETGQIKLYDFDQSMVKYEKDGVEKYSKSVVTNFYFKQKFQTPDEEKFAQVYNKIISEVEKGMPEYSLIGNIGHSHDFYRIIGDVDTTPKRTRVFCALLDHQCDQFSFYQIATKQQELFTKLNNRQGFFTPIPIRPKQDSVLLRAKDISIAGEQDILSKVFETRFTKYNDYFDYIVSFAIKSLANL